MQLYIHKKQLDFYLLSTNLANSLQTDNTTWSKSEFIVKNNRPTASTSSCLHLVSVQFALPGDFLTVIIVEDVDGQWASKWRLHECAGGVLVASALHQMIVMQEQERSQSWPLSDALLTTRTRARGPSRNRKSKLCAAITYWDKFRHLVLCNISRFKLNILV